MGEGGASQTRSLVPSFLLSSDHVRTQEKVWLDASGSEGAILEYQWDLDGDGMFEFSSSSPSQVASYARSGTYTIQLRVVDGIGITALSDVVTIEVANRAPIASFTLGSEASDLEGLVLLDASSDADGSIQSWAWDFGDGTSSNDANPEHQFSAAGTYTVTLVVSDDQGAASEPVSKVVPVANTPPQAAFSVLNAGSLNAGMSISFLDESVDPSPSGSIVHIAWDYGDGAYDVGGPRSNGVYSHVYNDAGTYKVVLYVIDSSGALSQAHMAITIHEI